MAAFLARDDTHELGRGQGENGELGGSSDVALTDFDALPKARSHRWGWGAPERGGEEPLMGPRETPSAVPAERVQK